jgi:protein O-mannosyl-transferase
MTQSPDRAASRRPGAAMDWTPALAAFLLYLPALRHGLVWDDTIFLRDLPVYRDPALGWDAVWRPFVLSPNYFRPLALASFMAELRLFGLEPMAFHLTNLLLHTLNTGLVVQLARSLLRPEDKGAGMWAPVLAGLLYGLHPSLVEGVAFASSRFDLLLTTGLLLALLADARLEGRAVRALAVGAAFLAAALCKEMALGLAVALPLWHLALERAPLSRIGPTLRKRWPAYAGVLAAGLAYLGLRWLALGHLLAPEAAKRIAAGNPLEHLLLVGRSAAEYGLLALWPFTSLSPIHYAALPIRADQTEGWLALAAAAGLLLGLVLWTRRSPGSGWLALAGAAALLPVLNVLPLELGGGAFVAERYLLFPLALLCLAALRLPPRLAGVWLVACVATVQLTLPHWRDEPSLWAWAARCAPRSAIPPANLALLAIDGGRLAEALDLARRAEELDPANADAWDNAGIALFLLKRYPEAQAELERAVKLQPQSALFWSNLAGALREQGRLQEAEHVLLDQALRLDPALPPAHLNLGIVYLMADRPDLAEQHLRQAERLLPPERAGEARMFLAQTREPARWSRLAELLAAHGEPEGARRAAEQARALAAASTAGKSSP